MLNIQSPTLLIDEKKCRDNIRTMADKIRKQNILFRPHFKTHQSVQVGKWFKEAGVNAITVSSLKMAEYFANNGWEDITVAFPVNLRETERIKSLTNRINLELVVADPGVPAKLNKLLKKPVNIWIKADTGYHRSGIPVEEEETYENIIQEIDSNPNLKLKGFLSHTGNTYHTESVEEINKLYSDALNKLKQLENNFSSMHSNLQISLGDTPSFSTVLNLSGTDEARPGNFVFFDLMQYYLGVCSLNQIAVAVACPVVSKKKKEKQVIVHGGAVHFSKEFVLDNKHKKIYGRIVKMKDNSWTNTGEENILTGLSQEHGTVQLNVEQFEKTKIGDLVYILPVHSCLTANLMKGYLSLEGIRIDHMEGKPSF
jgi:D-serine deaminase-like pyridoxal phosphate-dependent protein